MVGGSSPSWRANSIFINTIKRFYTVDLNIVMTNEDLFHQFPLIVSHSDYKTFHIPKVKTKGFIFENTEDATNYAKLLKQLGVTYTMCCTTGMDSILLKTSAVVTAALVRQLREETGHCIMTCKHALTQAQGDLELAKKMLTFVGTHRFHTCG